MHLKAKQTNAYLPSVSNKTASPPPHAMPNNLINFCLTFQCSST